MLLSAPEASSTQGFLDVWVAVGPIVGAIVGGGITWIVQRSALRSQREQAKQDALYQERKIAYVRLLRGMRARNDAMASVLDFLHEERSAQEKSGGNADSSASDETFDEMWDKYSAATSEMLNTLYDVLMVGSHAVVKVVIELSDDLIISMPATINDDELESQADAANQGLITLTAAMRKDLGHIPFAEAGLPAHM